MGREENGRPWGRKHSLEFLRLAVRRASAVFPSSDPLCHTQYSWLEVGQQRPQTNTAVPPGENGNWDSQISTCRISFSAASPLLNKALLKCHHRIHLLPTPQPHYCPGSESSLQEVVISWPLCIGCPHSAALCSLIPPRCLSFCSPAGAKVFSDLSRVPHAFQKEGGSWRCLMTSGGKRRVWNSVDTIGAPSWLSTKPECRRKKLLLKIHRLTRTVSGSGWKTFSLVLPFIAINIRRSINQRKPIVTCLQRQEKSLRKSHVQCCFFSLERVNTEIWPVASKNNWNLYPFKPRRNGVLQRPHSPSFKRKVYRPSWEAIAICVNSQTELNPS